AIHISYTACGAGSGVATQHLVAGPDFVPLTDSRLPRNALRVASSPPGRRNTSDQPSATAIEGGSDRGSCRQQRQVGKASNGNRQAAARRGRRAICPLIWGL